jgi:hypothetical protein
VRGEHRCQCPRLWAARGVVTNELYDPHRSHGGPGRAVGSGSRSADGVTATGPASAADGPGGCRHDGEAMAERRELREAAFSVGALVQAPAEAARTSPSIDCARRSRSDTGHFGLRLTGPEMKDLIEHLKSH